jgi:predicted anti-sigma-YlaC factor YlaD
VSVQHTDVAAYSFGLLEDQDRLEFEAHLAECESCTAEVAELSAMSSLFAGVDPVEPEQDQPGVAQVEDLMRRRATARRRTGRQRAFLAAAASVVLLGGGVAAGVAAASQPGPAPVLAMQGEQHTAANAATGVHGRVGLVDFAWGTQVILDLAGVRGPLTCQLVAVSRSGERRVIAGWQVPAAGYGVPGHPAHLLLAGGTSIARGDLARVEVDVAGGRRLLSIRI